MIFHRALLLQPVNNRLFVLVKHSRVIQRLFHGEGDVTTPVYSSAAFRRVPNSPEQLKELIRQPPERIPGSRLLKVAILGEPNAGKSTLVNQLSGWSTCAVSKKVHTTRKTSQTVLIEGATQIVFLDTPGLVLPAESKKHHLESSFLTDPERALMQADLLLVLHDVSNKWTRSALSPKILRLLHFYPDKQAILVLNKVDKIREKRLLLKLSSQLTEGIIGGQTISITPARGKTTQSKKPITLEDLSSSQKNPSTPNIPKSVGNPEAAATNLTESQVAKMIQGKIGWPHFSRVFLISALDGDGISEISDHLLESAQPGKWMYNSSVVTDQNPQDLAISIVRENLLDLLTNELPYSIDISIQHWEVDPAGNLSVVMVLDCKKAFTARLVVGTGGRTVMQIARETEQKLRNLFRGEVRLRLVVHPDALADN